jgi:hypothetical protein
MELLCIIHQCSVCGKNFKFEHVTKIVVSDVNFMRSHRQFQPFVLEIKTERENVLYHTEVRWPSLGTELKRFTALRLIYLLTYLLTHSMVQDII